jgi:hypothetical protein
MATRVARGAKQPAHPEAVAARNRVSTIIDAIPPEDLVLAIKRAPSLRGMILGYIAEEMFGKCVLKDPRITDVRTHDDHDRDNNKVDIDFMFEGRRVTIQLKSLQTNSIVWREDLGALHGIVQNDGSDKRDVKLPNGEIVTTTNYRVGDYNILAVPLFPFSGEWSFAYKLNRNCRLTTSNKYTAEQRKYLLATTEEITYPLGPDWSTDLFGTTRSL